MPGPLRPGLLLLLYRRTMHGRRLLRRRLQQLLRQRRHGRRHWRWRWGLGRHLRQPATDGGGWNGLLPGNMAGPTLPAWSAALLWRPEILFGCEFGSCSSGVPRTNLQIGHSSSGWYAVLDGTNYCGPGNMGLNLPAAGPVDAACMAHDIAYGKAHLSAVNTTIGYIFLTSSQQAAKRAADQKLCTDLKNISPQDATRYPQTWSNYVRIRAWFCGP